jgi:2-polyprenyl-3-methyl-5-hydroxy-6-metoxy-1,4-benzoquinol methylase
MLIKDFEGLKFPDEFMIKFFFKESLHNRIGAVLELGCANGNNLNLFFQYGYDVVGIDLSRDAIAMADRNFAQLKKHYNLQNSFSFVQRNIKELGSLTNLKSFDVVLLPNVINYLKKDEIETVLAIIKKNSLLKSGGYTFIRTRSLKDYRYNRGKSVGENEFVLSTKETGEDGLINTFFYESELAKLLERFFDFKYKYIFNIDSQNLQNSVIVPNSDIVIWGKVH